MLLKLSRGTWNRRIIFAIDIQLFELVLYGVNMCVDRAVSSFRATDSSKQSRIYKSVNSRIH